MARRNRILRACAVVLALIATLPPSACNVCEDDAHREISSPDGTWRAVVFRRNCGATTAYSTHVSLLRKYEGIKSGTELATFDADHGAAPVNDLGMVALDVTWLDEKTLRVAYPPTARIFQPVDQAMDIGVIYEEK